MKKSIKMKLWGFFSLVIVVIMFILFSYLLQKNLDVFEGLLVDGVLGMIVYVVLNLIAIVFAPVTVLPLVVVAVSLWGIFVTVFLTVFSWTVGAMIAFGLARKFGVPIIERFISLENIYKLEKRASIGGGFWNIVFLRMIIPVDVLSYALGLFSNVGFWTYSFATLVGIIPFTFIFAYLGKVSYIYQVFFGFVFLIGVLVYLIFKEIRV